MTDQNTAEVIELETDPIQLAFSAGVEEGSDEETIKMQMVQAGAKFTNVNKLYRKFSIDAGLDMSRQERHAKVAEIAEGYDLSDEDTVGQLCEQIESSIPGMTPQRAHSALKTYAKKNELKMFTRPKGSGPRTGFLTQFIEWMFAGEGVPSKEEAEAYISENGTANAKKRMERTLAYWEVANRAYSKFSH